jgi:hypothetical protein
MEALPPWLMAAVAAAGMTAYAEDIGQISNKNVVMVQDGSTNAIEPSDTLH